MQVVLDGDIFCGGFNVDGYVIGLSFALVFGSTVIFLLSVPTMPTTVLDL